MDKTLSCIIINTFCDFFVKKRTLPSIIKTTEHLKDWKIEIIIVDNSGDKDLEKKWGPSEYTNISVIQSTPYHLPKALNNGVKKSIHKYIAIFHDDCEIIEKNWVELMTQPLDDDVYATGSEMHYFSKDKRFYYLKEVPLVMERKKFIEIGGYDEKYYWGFENVELSQKILKKHNKNIKEIPIEYLHFNGMSTRLLQTKYDSNITTKEYDKIKRDFSLMKSKEEFKNYPQEKINISIPQLKIPFILKSIIMAWNRSTSIKTTKNIGLNLGYIQALEYWSNKINVVKILNKASIPKNLAFEMSPKTKEEMNLLIKDIKLNKMGALYSKLEKYKGKVFRDYFYN
jgi:GT2 family glycosyltransferase|tara:strand:- start:2993 stop:4018 length:1026 start_codon:yes stop_codon:yes gene_type:complete